MSITKKYIDFDGHSVCVWQIGEGPQPMVAFHGFADTGELFQALENPKYTIYGIDLPYHGETRWARCGYTMGDILRLIGLLAGKEHFERFDLLGFSLGGRIAMRVFQELKTDVDSLTLVAPDGVYAKWLWLEDAFPTALKRMAIPMLKRKSWVRSIAKRLRKLGMNEFSYKFVMHHTETLERRERMICSWVSMKSFSISIKKVRMDLSQIDIPVRFFVGANDRIVLPQKIQEFAESIVDARFQLLDGGHRSVMPALGVVL